MCFLKKYVEITENGFESKVLNVISGYFTNNTEHNIQVYSLSLWILIFTTLSSCLQAS